ncbi:MAG: ABC transporter permease, partial [Acidimicrobiia bacterium]
MSGHRSIAVFMRHFYTTLHSPPAIFDLFLWPGVDLIVWGVLTLYIRGSNLPAPVGFLIGGVLLWDLLFRSNLGIAVAFLDDTSWSRSVLNLVVSPLTPAEYVAGTAIYSFARLALTWGILALVALGLFSFNIFDLGLP